MYSLSRKMFAIDCFYFKDDILFEMQIHFQIHESSEDSQYPYQTDLSPSVKLKANFCQLLLDRPWPLLQQSRRLYTGILSIPFLLAHLYLNFILLPWLCFNNLLVIWYDWLIYWSISWAVHSIYLLASGWHRRLSLKLYIAYLDILGSLMI